MNSISPVINRNNLSLPTLSTRGNVALALITLVMTTVLLIAINKPQLFASLFGRAQRQPLEPRAQPSPFELEILSNDPPAEFDLSVLHEKLDTRNMEGVHGTLVPGLNMLGVCKTKGCVSEGKLAIIPKGLISTGPFSPSTVFFIDRECWTSKCTTCQCELSGHDVSDIAITETFFEIYGETTSGFNIRQSFGINRGDVIRINIQDFEFLHFTLEPLKCTKEKLL